VQQRQAFDSTHPGWQMPVEKQADKDIKINHLVATVKPI
jgi:hypothetical protein